MTAIIAWFPGDEDGLVLRESRGSSCCACSHRLPALGIMEPGFYRLAWPDDDENAPTKIERIADLPAIPDVS